jgi:hypothetical protein
MNSHKLVKSVKIQAVQLWKSFDFMSCNNWKRKTFFKEAQEMRSPNVARGYHTSKMITLIAFGDIKFLLSLNN